MVAMTAVMAGRSGWKCPRLAAAASQMGGNAVAYLIKLSVMGTFSQLSVAPSSCTQHCRMRTLACGRLKEEMWVGGRVRHEKSRR